MRDAVAPSWAGRRVLVTGGYGFVASHIIERLLGEGAQCVTLTIERPAESYLALQGLEDRVTVAWGSVDEAAAIERVLAAHEIEVVLHLAAQAIVGAAAQSPLTTFETNVRGTYTVLEECRRAWREGAGALKAVVVASSDKAYGEQPELPYSEGHPLRGLNPYDASKACADILARAYHHAYGLPVAVTRCANIYGPGDLNFSRIVPSVMRDLFRGEAPVIRSDGSPVRDYLFVGDAVAGYLALAEALPAGQGGGEAFNLGTGSPVSVLDLTAQIAEVAERPDLQPVVLGKAAGEISRQYLDSSKAAAQLGWRPTMSRAEGLRIAWDWYRAYLAGRPPA
jgi:CDP-glucose 4,6-dehydratase